MASIQSQIPNGKDVAHIPQEDPRWMYKAGETPRQIHNVDAAGWLANGWSYEKPSQSVVESVKVESTTVSDVQEDGRSRRTRKPSTEV